MTVEVSGPSGATVPDVVVAHGATGAAETFDATQGSYHSATLDANCTIALAAGPSGAWSMTIEFTQDGTGSRSLTWPASVKWSDGIPPTISPTAAAVTLIVLVTRDGGTTWYGGLVGKGFS